MSRSSDATTYTRNLISIIIPCRNEEAFIDACLESVVAFEVPDGCRTEILVIDGESEDRTPEILAAWDERQTNLRVLRNPDRYQSFAFNLALEQARGEWIVRLDAHSTYPSDYLGLCLETARRTGADNVGGTLITLPGGESYQARLVQALTTHRFGVGDSGFRTGAGEGPADTVPFGFFRREVFDRIGRMDERLIRAQDYEFNRRILDAGGKVWMNPAIRIFYRNQPTLAAFYRKQVTREAPYNAWLWYVAPYAFTPRHAVTGLFAAGVLGGLVLSPLSPLIAALFAGVMALYLVLALGAAVQQAARYRDIRHILVLPLLFFLYHFLHGLGVLWGLLRLATGTAPVQRRTGSRTRAGTARERL